MRIPESTDNSDENDSIANSPLAIPIFAGPGTIVTAMNFTTNANFVHMGIIFATFALVIFLTYMAFVFSEKIMEKIRQNLIAVVGKIMGLILAISGTGMIIEGIRLSFDLS